MGRGVCLNPELGLFLRGNSVPEASFMVHGGPRNQGYLWYSGAGSRANMKPSPERLGKHEVPIVGA